MLNSEDFYRDLGKKAAQARNEGDEARASSHARHFREARNLESDADRQAVSGLYDTAYKQHRRV